jgi:hypothetical protein
MKPYDFPGEGARTIPMPNEVANAVLRQYCLQKLSIKKRKKKSQDLTSSTIATSEQQE